MLMMSPDREFEFQLHELRYDLAALLRKVLELTPLMVPEKSQELERALSDICGSIEHDYIWHSSRALDLARPLAPHPEDCARRPDAETDRDSAERWARVDEVMSEVQDADELRRQLRPEIAELSASLHEAAASVARVEALRSRPDASAMQVEKLLEQVHAGLGEAMCLAFSAMQKATWHYRVTDPAAWQAEKDELERYEALETRVHPNARELSTCPSCGAALENMDRTETGSYCLTCRTMWEMPTDKV